MALKNCPECNKEVSDKVKNCPNCGYPLSENKNNKIIKEKNDELLEEKSIKDEKTNENPKNNHGLLYFLIFISLLISIFNFLNSPSSSNESNELLNTEEQIQKNRESIVMNRLSLISSEGVVTDKLVVQKALFYMWDDENIHATIDIRPQPIYNSKFIGGGEFDLTDRELRSSLEEICEEVINSAKDSVQNLSDDKQVEIERIYITANNYKVGFYVDGNVELSGE